MLGLPRQHLVGHPLERLPEHDEAATFRVARAEMEVRELALPPSVPPLRGEHDQIERVRGLDLEPTRAAPARFVRRRPRLRHDSLVPAQERIVEKRLRSVNVVGHETRDGELARQVRFESLESLLCRPVEQVVTVDVKTVEEECGEWPRGLHRWSCLRPESAHRHLERLGSSVVTECDRLAVEHDRRDIERAKRSDDLRHPLGDVGEVAGEYTHVVVHTVCLDTRAVELPLDSGTTQLLERAGHVLGGLSQHGRDRPQRRQPEASQAVDALAHGDRRDRRQVAGEHRRTPHG